jgi:hypothetical protein
MLFFSHLELIRGIYVCVCVCVCTINPFKNLVQGKIINDPYKQFAKACALVAPCFHLLGLTPIGIRIITLNPTFGSFTLLKTASH